MTVAATTAYNAVFASRPSQIGRIGSACGILKAERGGSPTGIPEITLHTIRSGCTSYSDTRQGRGHPRASSPNIVNDRSCLISGGVSSALHHGPESTLYLSALRLVSIACRRIHTDSPRCSRSNSHTMPDCAVRWCRVRKCARSAPTSTKTELDHATTALTSIPKMR